MSAPPSQQPAIVTLTLNPTIDGSSDAETVQHTHKVRTTNERFDPGGGGINVARVLTRLGAACEALYLAGGITGPMLTGLLDRIGIRHRRLAIAGDTRVSLNVHERQSGKEYRFVPQGPEVSAAEWQACLDAIGQLQCAWLVLSGSLPRGVPEDFYARAAHIAHKAGAQVVLDTSGKALKAALDGASGKIELVKPSLGELEQLLGQTLRDPQTLQAAALSLVERGAARMVAVSMGHEGALLASAEGVLALPAIPVEVRSAVGAGDSFVAAMTYGLAHEFSPQDAFRLGIAAGTAAVLSPGTDLCMREDIVRLAETLGVRDV